MNATTLIPACPACQRGHHDGCTGTITQLQDQREPTPCQCHLDHHDRPTQLDLFALLEGDLP
ncbi:hypothetical protein [Brachybacterium alimentarium]|uniref:hypothetical protein n=1 Tax=Brachybacterium alimentarium TaxID=47845 RepID=UPI003FD0F1F4